jgi:hypothetical protein
MLRQVWGLCGKIIGTKAVLLIIRVYIIWINLRNERTCYLTYWTALVRRSRSNASWGLCSTPIRRVAVSAFRICSAAINLIWRHEMPCHYMTLITCFVDNKTHLSLFCSPLCVPIQNRSNSTQQVERANACLIAICCSKWNTTCFYCQLS